MSTVRFGPKQDTLIALYQKDHLQLLGYGIYIQMLMIIWLATVRLGPTALSLLYQEKYFHQI
jgi:hypothetical protein